MAVNSGQTSFGIKAANGLAIASEKKLPSISVGDESVQKIQSLTPNIGVAYSPSGKLVEIKHLPTAVSSGQTSLGIKAANGVVIASKKSTSIPVGEASVQKIQSLTPNIGVVYSGMDPDFRVLVMKSQKQARQYHRIYKETITVTRLVRETAAVMKEFTQRRGISQLIAGYDDNGPHLYQVDPSGSYFSCKISAMGENVPNAKTFLENRYSADMEIDDAIHTAILALKEGYDGQISANNIEIGFTRADRAFMVLASSFAHCTPEAYISLTLVILLPEWWKQLRFG